jgi:membrane-bound lytic murein transglycosylase B
MAISGFQQTEGISMSRWRDMKGKRVRGAWVCLMAAALLVPLTAAAGDKAAGGDFALLKKRLIADGFDAALVEGVYADPAVTFETRGVSLFFVHRESTLNYDQFLEAKNLSLARNYMQTHREALAAAQKDFGVAPEVITAIILVETRLGTVVGGRSILNTLSTMAALENPGIRADFWDKVPKNGRLSRDQFESKADQKSDWAYKELKSFLRYAEREAIPPTAVQGSYAGAFGICQFMPSNALSLAQDGNGDGRVDLFDHTDAIFSVARYLEHHGWRPDIDREKAYKVILRYNYSRYYANTILAISERLEA